MLSRCWRPRLPARHLTRMPYDKQGLLCAACCLSCCRQVIILPATAEPALIEAAKLAAAAAAGTAAANDSDSSTEPTVQLQRPSLFTYSKVRSLAAQTGH